MQTLLTLAACILGAALAGSTGMLVQRRILCSPSCGNPDAIGAQLDAATAAGWDRGVAIGVAYNRAEIPAGSNTARQVRRILADREEPIMPTGRAAIAA